MAVRYRTLGFLIKKKDLGEADQLLTFYTEGFGKLDVLGKAIRKIKSKLRPGAELFYLSEVEFIQGKTYKTLTDAMTTEKFKNIRKDLGKLQIVYQVSKLADSLIRAQEKDEKIWNLLNEVFEKLNDYPLPRTRASTVWGRPTIHYPLIYYYFLWNLLSILGYQIDLYNCAACQKKLLPQKLYFNPKKGGIICSNCFKQDAEEVSPEVIKILRIFLKKDWQTLLKLKIDKDHRESLKSISGRYLSYYERSE